jgi:hypothetical protein
MGRLRSRGGDPVSAPGPNPSGLCMCGCGRETPLATRSKGATGQTRGAPIRYCHGHGSRIVTPDYVELDAGYDSPCWIWQNALSDGYGVTTVDARSRLAHRVYWERANGPIPAGLDMHHKCENRACVRPDHLEPLTRCEHIAKGPRAKLTVEEARSIRSEYARGGGSFADLARRHNVSRSSIGHIVSGRTWAVAS